ncbi:MAG: alanine racemase [Clostridia bacterium]|nr:alanine racemase [Clostridia bacterium]
MDIREIKWAEVNLDHLIHNLKQIRQHVGEEIKIAAVVKANGYGHGALEMADVLLNNGADMLAVSSINEAVEIRKQNPKAQTLVLGYTPSENIEEAIKHGVIQTIYSYHQAIQYSKVAERIGMGISIHIKIDTGMNRIGFQPNDEALKEIIKIYQLPNVKINGIFSHLACADEADKTFSYQQYELFLYFIEKLQENNIKIPIKHISNSAAIMDMPDMNMDMVRPGIILYGLYPSNEVKKDVLNLKPVMSFKTRISHVKTLSKDGGISYGLKYQGKKGQKIATIPVGYADGYTRLLSNKGHAIVHGKKAPVVGTVCMDQCMLDVSMIDDVKAGDEVLLFGGDNSHSITTEEVAECIGTINYETICMVGRRVPRVYIKNGEIVKIKDYLK